MKLDDPNLNPEDPMVCKSSDLVDERLPLLEFKVRWEALKEHLRWDAFSYAAKYFGATDQLEVRRVFEQYKKGPNGQG